MEGNRSSSKYKQQLLTFETVGTQSILYAIYTFEIITTLSVQRSRFIDGNVMKNNFPAGVVSISAECLWDLLSMCWSTGVFYSRYYRPTLPCELLRCTTSTIRYTDSPADHTAAARMSCSIFRYLMQLLSTELHQIISSTGECLILICLVM